MLGAMALVYGVLAYALFLVTFLYAAGFVGNLIVPRSIDAGGTASSFAVALAVNLALLALFAVQHSVMARPGFKKWWTGIVPPSIERSTFVLLTNGVLILMYWQWRPMTGVVWSVEAPAARAVLDGLFWVGWVIVLISTFMINHFDLFGLRQVWLRFRGREYHHLEFNVGWLYKFVRHPIMLGFVIAFWSTPHMSVGHLVFAIMTTAYILVALQLEERDLVTYHGNRYQEYQKATPMLIPLPKGRAGG